MTGKRLLPFLSLLLAAAFAGAPAEARVPQKKAVAKKAVAKKGAGKAARKTAGKKATPARPKIDYTGEEVNFAEWSAVAAFEDEMVTQNGFTREEMDAIIKQARFVDSAVQLVKPAPPGKPKNWQAYSARFIEPVRISAGVRFWNDNAEALARAEVQYGVPAEIIVGIIGVETLYGRDTGRFRVLDVLTTLAFAYPETPNREARMAFFRDELEYTLVFARQNRMDPFSLLGSFAGAVGMPQFMPGSILKFGVDFDNDGSVDLRNSPADAIGSVANFLVQHGWQRDQPGDIVYHVDVSPARKWERFIGAGLTPQFTAEELAEAGVVPAGPVPPGQRYGLVDLQNGAEPTEYWLGTNNFYTITQYNRSFFYAMSVIELGRAVKLARAG
jgi:membrane-bound lytic murein transglycosylase B